MDKRRVFIKNGRPIFRVDKISSPKVEIRYIHPDYVFHFEEGGLTDTGLLNVFKIDSLTSPSCPQFVGRWDQSVETLDVDVFNVSTTSGVKFRAGKDGFTGHHPQRLSDSNRSYNITVRLPTGMIFDGSVSFNVNWGHAPELCIRSKT
jgi:hypothetical protein